MRNLTENELDHVHGADGESANQVACATAVAAVSVATGTIAGQAASQAAGVLSIPAVVACQSATTALGQAAAAGIASLGESFDELVIDAEDSFGNMAMTLNRGTL